MELVDHSRQQLHVPLQHFNKTSLQWVRGLGIKSHLHQATIYSELAITKECEEQLPIFFSSFSPPQWLLLLCCTGSFHRDRMEVLEEEKEKKFFKLYLPTFI